MRMTWRSGGVVAGVVVALAWFASAPFRPQAIAPYMSDAECRQSHPVGRFRVTLCARPDAPGDNGPVTITIGVDGATIGTIASDYNYDTLMSIPAGHTMYRWIDADWRLDLLLDPHHTRTGRAMQFIGSRDGHLHPLP